MKIADTVFHYTLDDSLTWEIKSLKYFNFDDYYNPRKNFFKNMKSLQVLNTVINILP